MTSDDCLICVFQIVSSKTLTRPLQLKKGKPAGKGSISVRTSTSQFISHIPESGLNIFMLGI